MEKLRLGKTGMMVTKLGFGGIPIQRVSEEEAISIVRKVLDLGINFIDTANGYSTSEERIGKAIAGRKREELFIATKTLARRRELVEQHLNLSLKRLNVPYIDLYQFHQVSDAKGMERVMAPDGPLAFVEQAKKAGIVRHIGVSSHTLDIAKELVKTNRFETIMFPFNFITSEPLDELLPLVRERDMGFIAMKPLGGGMIPNVKLCIKYLLQFPDILLIPGIEHVPEIEEIMQIVQGPRALSDAERREMQRIKEELGTQFCRRCDYCQPCSAGIPISGVMTTNSAARRLPEEQIFGGWVADAMEKAASCIDCGDCEERCPYHLPIRKIMAEQLKWYQEAKRLHLEKTGKKPEK